MTVITPLEGESTARAGIIRLRLNLAGLTSGKPTEIRTCHMTSPQKSIKEQKGQLTGPTREIVLSVKDRDRAPGALTTLSRSSSSAATTTTLPLGSNHSPRRQQIRLNSVVGDENKPEVENLPLKLTVRLKTPVSPHEEEKRKIVLSVKKKAEEKSESIDIETVDQPRERVKNALAPKVKRVKTTEDTDINKGGVRLKKASPINGTPHPFATLPTVTTKPPQMLATKIPIPNFRPSNMTRVPIAALSSLTTMTPSEREEERLTRQCISETFGTLWSMVTKPDPKKTFENWQEIPSKLIPYWLMLSPIDSALNIPTLKMASADGGEPIVDRATKVCEEFLKIKSRFDEASLRERNKQIATELLVLEQRLCLEEEKFLYAKLKNEYNRKISEFMVRKRQQEGPLLASGTTLNPHQRILPKMGSSWVSGSGIQILRGNSTENNPT